MSILGQFVIATFVAVAMVFISALGTFIALILTKKYYDDENR